MKFYNETINIDSKLWLKIITDENVINEKGIIHVHHVNKVSYTNKEHNIDPVKELIPLCPNCHTVVHSKKEMFTIAEMKEIIETQKILKTNRGNEI